MVETTGDRLEERDGVRDSYTLSEELPSPESFVALREAAGMAPRSLEAVERGLPNSVFGVTVVCEPTGETVGMGRIVGDDGAVYHLCDMAVHPDHQRKGLGTKIMDALVTYIEETAPQTAYVNLVADVDGFYERFGFEETRPASKGMYHRE
ncbi:MAG TPA: GNAT family N-acetyltransferase [Halococcus sp.]|nr:GNAT family N-acetyltransferase [Halococcus sp.]